VVARCTLQYVCVADEAVGGVGTVFDCVVGKVCSLTRGDIVNVDASRCDFVEVVERSGVAASA